MNRWENSLYWARNFSPLLQTGILRVARFDFTAQQVLTFGTIPITLFPANPGYTYYPHFMVFFKSAGPVFTTAGQTIDVQWMNSIFSLVNNFLSVGVLDQLAEASYIRNVGINFISDELVNHVGGKGIRITTSTGVNFGGTGSPCSIMLAYYIVPTTLAPMGGPSTPLP